jgi:hypothetical protein
MDRAARVEGGQPTVRLVVGRRAAWCTFLASNGQPLLLPAYVVEDLGHVLASVARQTPADLPFRGER